MLISTNEEYLKSIITAIAANYGSGVVENAIESLHNDSSNSEGGSQRDLRLLFPGIEFSRKQEYSIGAEHCNPLINGFQLKGNTMEFFGRSEAVTRKSSAIKNHFEV